MSFGLLLLFASLAGAPGVGAPSETTLSGPCATCHEREAASWERSRHRVAFTNQAFQFEYQQAPDPFCLSCHAPNPKQQAEIAKVVRDDAAPVYGPLASDGVSCEACHLRDGVVLGSTGAEAPHPTAKADLSGAAMCDRCHDADYPHAPGEALQATVREWREWGGAEGCVACHMPSGSHATRASYDPETLAASVRVDLRRNGDSTVFTLSSVGVGHALPTGDQFRHLDLGLTRADGSSLVAARLGRVLQPELVPGSGRIIQRQVLDTRLWPGTPLVVTVPDDEYVRWWLRYAHVATYANPMPWIPLAGGELPPAP